MESKNVVTLIIDGKNKAVTAIQSAIGDLTKLDAASKKAGGSIMSVDGLLKKAFAGFTVALAAQELFQFMKATINTADGLNKMSQRVGMSVESLSKLRYAAELNDVTIEDLDSSLDKLNKNIYAAAGGNGSAAEAFRVLGVSVTDVNGRIRDTESVFMDLTNNFVKLPDSVKKSALSMEIFGKSGANLIPLLNNGTEGVKSLMQQAKELGVEISTNTAIQAEALNDQLTTLKFRAEGLAIKVMPGLITEFSEFAYLIDNLSLENVYRYLTWQEPKGFSEFQKQLEEAARKRAEIEKAKNEADEKDATEKAKQEAEKRKFENAETRFLNYKKSIIDNLLVDNKADTEELKDQLTVFVDIQEQLKNYPLLQKQSAEIFDLWLDKTNAMSTANVPELLFQMDKLGNEFGIIPAHLELSKRYLKEMKDPIKKITDTISAFKEGGFDVPMGVKPVGLNKDNPFGIPTELKGIDTTNIEASIAKINQSIKSVSDVAIINFLLMEGSLEQTFGNMAQASEAWYQITGEKQSVYFEMYKAFAIGEAAINTYNSAIAAYKAMVGVPIIGPGLAVAAAASAAAFGYANIRKIASATPGNGASGISGTSSIGGIGSGSGIQSMINSNNTNKTTTNAPNIYINITGTEGLKNHDAFAREISKSIQKLFTDGIIKVNGNG